MGPRRDPRPRHAAHPQVPPAAAITCRQRGLRGRGRACRRRRLRHRRVRRPRGGARGGAAERAISASARAACPCRRPRRRCRRRCPTTRRARWRWPTRASHVGVRRAARERRAAPRQPDPPDRALGLRRVDGRAAHRQRRRARDRRDAVPLASTAGLADADGTAHGVPEAGKLVSLGEVQIQACRAPAGRCSRPTATRAPRHRRRVPGRYIGSPSRRGRRRDQLCRGHQPRAVGQPATTTGGAHDRGRGRARRRQPGCDVAPTRRCSSCTAARGWAAWCRRRPRWPTSRAR